jgi:hypothetical protein
LLLGAEIALGVVVGIAVVCAVMFSRRAALRRHARDAVVNTPAPTVSTGEVRVLHRNGTSVEGLEIRYASDALVRAVRVGAMNSEHKELLLTMDEVQWRALPNAQKQEVLAAARSTWAQKMCGDGPDIAYVVMKTERGEIIGRADPHSVTVI